MEDLSGISIVLCGKYQLGLNNREAMNAGYSQNAKEGYVQGIYSGIPTRRPPNPSQSSPKVETHSNGTGILTPIPGDSVTATLSADPLTISNPNSASVQSTNPEINPMITQCPLQPLHQNSSSVRMIGWGGSNNLSFESLSKKLYNDSVSCINPFIMKNNGTWVELNTTKEFFVPHGFCYKVEDISTKDLTLSEALMIYYKAEMIQLFIVDSSRSTDYLLSEVSFSIDSPTDAQTIPKIDLYEISIQKNIQDENNPKTQCTNYGTKSTKYSSFQECMEEEQNIQYSKLIGCMPPYMTKNETRKCRKPLNSSLVLPYINYYQDNIRPPLIYHQEYFIPACYPPCQTLKIHAKKLMEEEAPISGFNLYFSSTVQVTETQRSFTEITLLVEVGSAFGFYLGWSCISIIPLLKDFFELFTPKKKMKQTVKQG